MQEARSIVADASGGPAQDLKSRAKAALHAVLRQYTAGEAEVVRVYFAVPHTAEEHLQVLLKQIGREVQVAHWLHRLPPMGEQLERTVGRWELYGVLEQVADEIKHHAMLADLAEWLAGRKLTAEELRRYEANAFWGPDIDDRYLHPPELPEASRMVDVTRELLSDYAEPFWKGLVKISEGGGGAAFVEASRVTGGEFEERLAPIMGDIVKDELRHGPEQVEGFVEAQIHSEADLERAVRGLTKIMAQHLRVRNEIWGNPLAQERLAAIDRGDVEPWGE